VARDVVTEPLGKPAETSMLVIKPGWRSVGRSTPDSPPTRVR